MRKKCTALLCALLVLLLCACGEQPEGGGEPDTPPLPQSEHLTVRVSAAQTTLDPAYVTAQGGETILYHLYENLLCWEDDGSGWAVLTNGQAESYTVETDYAGNATYTFTLRQDARWSDGVPVKAEDFVHAWQRLADPAKNTPHRELLAEIAGFQEVQETGDVTLLGVSASGPRTLTVTLNGSPSYFLEEICAGAYTMPLRADLPSYANAMVTNGRYTAASGFTGALVSLKRSDTYYAPLSGGPETIRFVTMEGADADYAALQAGEAALIASLPASVLEEQAASGLWTPDPVTCMYGVLLNCGKEPFDNANVRLAFHLAVDRQAIVDALGNFTSRPAPGVVPYGVSDFSERPAVELPVENDAPPDPNAQLTETPEPAPTCWDFRTHSLEVVTAEHTHDYESDCNYAKALLAQAGFPGGSGFPAVEYLYHSGSEEEKTIAGLLQTMWRDCLGVTVTLRGVSETEYQTALVPVLPEETEEEDDEEPVPCAPFQMAAQDFAPPYSDALALLERWYSDPDQAGGYASSDFDILLDAAHAAVSAEAKDAYLHDAEAILLKDSPVIPILCRGGSYQLAEGLTGLCRAPDGVYFLYGIRVGSETG